MAPLPALLQLKASSLQQFSGSSPTLSSKSASLSCDVSVGYLPSARSALRGTALTPHACPSPRHTCAHTCMHTHMCARTCMHTHVRTHAQRLPNSLSLAPLLGSKDSSGLKFRNRGA